MSGAAQGRADRGQPPTLHLIRSTTGRPDVGPGRARPWRDLDRTLTADPELLRRLLACPTHELVAAVSSGPDAAVFWDIIERIFRRRSRTIRSLA